MSVSEWYAVTNLASLVALTYLSGFMCHRIWRMFARDSIFERPRVAITSKSEFIHDLVDCPWCLGWWLNVAFAAVLYFAADLIFPSAVIVAFVGSTITGVLGRGD